MSPAPIESKTALIEDLCAGNKPAGQWRIGTEHEKFAFDIESRRPLAYPGVHGIESLLRSLHEQFGWNPVYEGDSIIALQKDGGSITLEPAGQFELSGAPLRDLHQTCDEVHTHLRQVKTVSEPRGIGFLGMGFAPTWRREDMPWMPKARYAIMRAHMPRVGQLGLDMMVRTATVQVNLDFCDEADMVKKFRVALALQPLATALFANSPFTEGKPNGWLSYRSAIWRDTDPARCGMLPFVFESGMGFERYVDYMLDVPMYFVYRGGRYIDASGQSFRDFLDGRLPALPGEKPLFSDWQDHLTTAFPEVRLKRFLEMRGADSGSWERLCALPAFWVGLLYDTTSLDAAWELVKDWDAETRERIRNESPRIGFDVITPAGNLRDLARRVLALATDGLARRRRLHSSGRDETHFIDGLWEIVESGKTPAQRKLDAYHGDWKGQLEPLFDRCAYW